MTDKERIQQLERELQFHREHLIGGNAVNKALIQFLSTHFPNIREHLAASNLPAVEASTKDFNTTREKFFKMLAENN